MSEECQRLRQDDARREAGGDGRSEDDGRGWIGWLQIAAVVLVVLIAVALTVWLSNQGGEAGERPPERPPVPVRVTEPVVADHQVDIEVTGTVTVTAFVNLVPEVGGRVIEVSDAVRTGASFTAGEILFRIDPRDYEVALTRARSQLATARSQFAQTRAEAEVAREEWDNLYPGQPITALAAREPQLEAARGQLLSAEAQVRQAELDLERTTFSLPFSGRITESRLEVGQQLAPGQSYGTAYDFEAVELVAPVPPTDLARIGAATGRPAQVRLEAGGPVFEAVVARTGARLDARTRFIDLYIDPGAEGRTLQPGLFADVRILGPELENVMILPANAVIGLDQVRLVEDGAIVSERVQVLDRPRGRVIVRPFDIHDGLIVSPLPEGAEGRDTEIVETVEPPAPEFDPGYAPAPPLRDASGERPDSPAEAEAMEEDRETLAPPEDRAGERG
ncbi:MAG: efflux RND transporter periplasmic adaptor subunit [Oceanicaulis sp.]